MAWFEGFRDHGRNTYYGDHRNPVLADITHLLVILICIMFSAALVLVIIGTRGRERWTTFLRVAFTLHTGVAILITVFGQEWQVAFVQSHCSYTTRLQDEIMAYIHVKVGLKSVNITLEGDLVSPNSKTQVDYNERFNFNHIHDMARDVLDAKLRGLPQPILYVAEYFEVDAGGLTWNRAVRIAGHFVFILEWASLAAWIVSNIVVNFVVFHGAAIMTLAGAMMTGSCVLYNFLQPDTPFTIPFEDGYIHFSYGWCFWLCAVSGAVTLLTGFIILVLYKVFPIKVQLIFLLDTSHLVEHDDDDTDVPPLQLGLMTRKVSQASQRSYVNRAFKDDTGQMRFRPRGPGSFDSTAETEQEFDRCSRRVSTISISSVPGQDDAATVVINGIPVGEPDQAPSSSEITVIPEVDDRQESATAL